MMLLVAICTILLFQAASKEPPALIAMQEARRAIRTADIQWALGTYTGVLAGKEQKFVSRHAADGDYIFENHGDQDGVVEYDVDGRGRSAYPLKTLFTPEGMHLVRETVTVLEVTGDADRADTWRRLTCYDALTLGLVPTVRHSRGHVEEALENFPAPGLPRVYQERCVNGIHEVTARIGDSEPYAYVTWQIDPQRGWNAQRITCSVGDQEGHDFEAVMALRRCGEVWFPCSIAYYGKGKLYHMVTIYSASFNQPGDPVAFTPNDIGAEPGFTVTYRGRPSQPVASMMLWGGGGIMPVREYLAAVRSGAIRDGPLVQELQRYGEIKRPYPVLSPVERLSVKDEVLTTWQRYVRDFIVEYGLDADQAQKAWQILAQCEQHAQGYVTRKKQALALLDERLEAARGTETFANVRAEIAPERAELLRPLDDIFEQELKARLNKLPTRAQRARAEPASQPVGGELPN